MSSTTLNSESLLRVLEFSKSLAREAGALILEGSEAIAKESPAVDEKKNSVDLVTRYDKAVEELVKKRVAETYPDFGLYVHFR